MDNLSTLLKLRSWNTNSKPRPWMMNRNDLYKPSYFKIHRFTTYRIQVI